MLTCNHGVTRATRRVNAECAQTAEGEARGKRADNKEGVKAFGHSHCGAYADGGYARDMVERR